MKYEDIIKFTSTTKCSKSKIYRFYKKNEDLFAETILKGKRMFPIEHARYFDIVKVFEENKSLRKDNRNLESLIHCLAKDNNGFLTMLWHMDWTFFCTVAYVDDMSQNSCSNRMRKFYNFLESKYDGELRLFFTTENFAYKDGSHNHFILYVSDKETHLKIMNEIKRYFSFDRTDVQFYEKMKAGVFYIAKEGLTDENWDILGNNLGGIKTDTNG